jgi:hypothetical protein
VSINILGAYDPIRNILQTVINKTYITAETVCEMLKKLKAEYGDKKNNSGIGQRTISKMQEGYGRGRTIRY